MMINPYIHYWFIYKKILWWKKAEERKKCFQNGWRAYFLIDGLKSSCPIFIQQYFFVTMAIMNSANHIIFQKWNEVKSIDKSKFHDNNHIFMSWFIVRLSGDILNTFINHNNIIFRKINSKKVANYSFLNTAN